MIEALRDRGDYVVLTKDEYSKLAQPQSSTPAQKPRKLADFLPKSEPVVKPKFTFQTPDLSLPRPRLQFQSPAIKHYRDRAHHEQVNASYSIPYSHDVPKLPLFSGDESPQKGGR